MKAGYQSAAEDEHLFGCFRAGRRAKRAKAFGVCPGCAQWHQERLKQAFAVNTIEDVSHPYSCPGNHMFFTPYYFFLSPVAPAMTDYTSQV